MCGGGGDGGGEAAVLRKEEAQRDYEIARDKARINALFGITDFDYADLPSPEYSAGSYPGARMTGSAEDVKGFYGKEIAQLDERIAALQPEEGEATSLFPGRSPAFTDQEVPGSEYYDLVSDREKTQTSLDAFLKQLGDYDPVAAAGEAESNLATREATLEGIYQDILGKSTYELDKQFDRKEADVLAMLADRGLSRSTVGQTTFDRLGEIYDTKEAEFEGTAKAATDAIRKGDAQTRQNLIQMIDAGGDYSNARQSALSGMEGNITAGTNIGRAQNLTELFKEMDEIYGQKQYVDAYSRGSEYGRSNIVTPGSSGGGSTGTAVNY